MIIERLTSPVNEADLRALAQLLADTVSNGDAVSFLAPLPVNDAAAWWRKTLTESHLKSVFLVARDAEGIAGTVQLHPAWAPNQPHRAEVAKLMIHPRARRRGLGRLLMQAVESAARESGCTLLTLDARSGGAAERLYRDTGWIPVGTIPDFALDPDGRGMHATVIFYKNLVGPGDKRGG